MFTTFFSFEYYYSRTEASYQPTQTSSDIQVTVYPYWYQYADVEWVIPADWGDCSFTVSYADTQSGPFTVILPKNIKDKRLKHYQFPETSKFSKTFYVVTVTRPNGSQISSEPTTWKVSRHHWVDIRAKEIQRREWWLLTRFVGVKSAVFNQRIYGKRCPNCWDPRLYKSIVSDCPVCFGTTFDGGYYKPILTFLQYNPITKSSTYSYPGKIEADNVTAWTISYPLFDPGDLVYRVEDGKLFSVQGSQQTELQAAVLKQELSLSELAKRSIEYTMVRNEIEQIS